MLLRLCWEIFGCHPQLQQVVAVTFWIGTGLSGLSIF